MTAKSRYLASKEQHHGADMIGHHLDDPPPPPPNPPTKRGSKSRNTMSAATSRTSMMSSSRNSDPALDGGDVVPPESISVGSGTLDFNYDDILAEDNKSEESSQFSVPILSISSEETSSKVQPKSKSKQQYQTKQRSKISSSSSRKSSGSNRHDLQSTVSSDSSLGLSQMDSVMSPPPPPPGAPPGKQNRPSSSGRGGGASISKSTKSGYSSKGSRRRDGGASVDSRGSTKKAEFHTSEFSNVDFDLGSLRSDRSNSTKSRTVDKSVKSSKSKRSENGGTSVSAKSSSMASRHSQSQSQAQSKSTVSRRTDDILDDLVLEAKDSDSVKTEVLRFGEVNETKSISHSTMSDKSWSNTKDAKSSTSASESTMSVAEKRRRKAMAAAGSTSLETNSVAKSTSSSRDTQLTSNAKKVVEDKPVKEEQPQAKPEDDPPLVLFNSDDESDQSEDESAKRAIQKKGKKKKGGFMKKLMRIGNKSPAKERKGRNSSPVADKKVNKNSPFRKRPTSRPQGTIPDEETSQQHNVPETKQAEAVESGPNVRMVETPKAEKPQPERTSFTKNDSDLSFEPSKTSLSRLNDDFSKLESENMSLGSSRRSVRSSKETREEESPEITAKVDENPIVETTSVKSNRSYQSKSRKSHHSRSLDADSHQSEYDQSRSHHSKSLHSKSKDSGSHHSRSLYSKSKDSGSHHSRSLLSSVKQSMTENEVDEDIPVQNMGKLRDDVVTHGSRSTVDPPENSIRNIDLNDNNSTVSDEVSEMTNPTYVSNRMDPPEEEKISGSRSVRSSRTHSDSDTPLMSNQLGVLPEDTTTGIEEDEEQGDMDDQIEDEFFGGRLDWANRQEHNKFFMSANSINEQSVESKDPFEEPFYPAVNMGTSKESEKKLNLDYSVSDDDSEARRSYVRDQATISEESEQNDEVASRSTASNSFVDNSRRVQSTSRNAKRSSPRTRSQSPTPSSSRMSRARSPSPTPRARSPSPNASMREHRSKSPLKIDVKKVKSERRARNQSPSKAEVMKMSSSDNGFLGIDDNGAVTVNTDSAPQKQNRPSHSRSRQNSISPSHSSRNFDNTSPDRSHQNYDGEERQSSNYFRSPGVKLGLTKSDDGFLRDVRHHEESKSPEYAKTPKFLAKRQNRDKKEEDIRSKLENQRQAAVLNAKKRMENVSKAAETGRRRDIMIDSSNERSSPEKLSAIGRHLSPLRSRQRGNSVSPLRTELYNETRSVSPSRSTSSSVSPPRFRRQVKVNTVAAPGSFRGEKGSLYASDRSTRSRTPNSMRVIESTRGSGPPMRVAKSYSSENDDYDCDSVGYSVPENQPVTKKAFKAPAAFSKDASVKRFKAPEAFKNPEMVPALSMEIADPIQRAGMRLLSAAAVPIQTEIRRYLAKRVAEDRLWAVVVIQSYFRRWKAELMMYKTLYCATKIQAVFRGWLVRDTIDHKHYCATQIQRVCRGYLATMKVYEALYNITVVQSIARRNFAITEAGIRYQSVVTIQSAWRGYSCRCMVDYKHENALIIQTAWRSFIAQLNYQFDIVDIIIVQSIARRRACQKRYAAMLHKRHTKAAIVIQKYWRSYDCTMNYLHSIADILIVQSVVRRWIAVRYVPRYREQRNKEMATRIQTAVRGWVARRKLKKYKSAVMIQKSWKGFKQYIEYIFIVADVVLVQKTVRSWLAKRHFEQVKRQRGEEKIEAAAVMIQKTWRGYQAHMNMLFTLVHIIIVQSVIRRRIAIVKFKPMRMEHRASITIQCAFRVKMAKRTYAEESAARKIQAAVRGWFAYSSYSTYTAARRIQSWYRCQATRRGYLYYISARKIQTSWRGYDARKLADEERWVREYAATIIQKNWRMHSQYSKYTRFITEKRAATKIQSQWRCFWEYSHFVILRYELIRIQAAVRGYQTRKRCTLEHSSATVIQTAARVMLAKRFCHMERLFSTVMYSAQMSLTYKNATMKLQKGFRDLHYSLKEKRAALVIERFFIWVRNEVEKEIERREKMKQLKRQKQRSKKIAYQENILDNVWEETVETASKHGNDLDEKKVKSSSRNVVERLPERSPARSRTVSARKQAPERIQDVSPTRSRAVSVKRQVSQRVRDSSPAARSINSRSSIRKHAQSVGYGSVSKRKNAIPAQAEPSSPLLSKKLVHDLDNKQISPARTSYPLDFDDVSSEVSCLTTPTLSTPRISKGHKTRDVNTSLDEELNLAWAETRQRVLQKRSLHDAKMAKKQIQEEGSENSSKENSISPPKARMSMSYDSPTRTRRYQSNPVSPSKSPTRSLSGARSEMFRLSREGSTR